MFLILLLLSYLTGSSDELGNSLPVQPAGFDRYEYPIPEDENCAELGLNQSRMVNISDDDAHTGVGGAYRVTRLQNQEYRIDLNLNFRVSGERTRERISDLPAEQRGFFTGLQVRSSNQIEEETMLRRSQFCLNHYQDRFRSPDGRRINIVLNSEESAFRVPRRHQRTVELMTTEHSSNRDSWENGIDCTVIIHEIFHQLGLPDGYPPNSLSGEELNNFRSRSDVHLGCSHHSSSTPNCRHVEPSGIMNDFNAMISEDNARYVEALSCRPQVISIGPRRVVRGELPSECPDGFYIYARTRQRRPYSRLNGWQSRRRDGGILYMHVSRTNSSQPILGNAHVNHIVNPLCVSKNRRYLTCVQNAGRRSNCLPTPDYCRGDFIN